MVSVRMTTLAVWFCVGVLSTVACAQTSTRGTTAGATQQGATQGTTSATGASGITGSSALGSALGTGGSGGAGGSGGSAPAMSTANQPLFNAANGSVGAMIGQNGFTGRGNTAFVGNRNAMQNANTSLLPQFNQMDDGQQGNQGTTSRANKKRARPQQKIAFTYPKASLAATQLKLGPRMKRLTGISGVNTALTDEGVATLTGRVATEDARKLAEIYTRQEPGVRSVVNELQVAAVSP